MSLLSQPLYILTVLLVLVVFAEWLGQRKYFSYIGSSLIVILAAAVLANTGVIPSSGNAPPLYGGIFQYITPLAIFYLLLDVRLKDLRYAGLPMLIMFFVGSVCTVIGTMAGYYIVAPQFHGIDKAYAVAGMYTGTYIGGSANLNAVALHYGVLNNGTEFAAINAVDNIIGTIWIMATMALPPLLQRWLPRKTLQRGLDKKGNDTVVSKEEISVIGLSMLLLLGIASLLFSQWLSEAVPSIPAILTITTVALVLAQLSFVQRLQGSKTLGYFMVLLFLAVVGAYCDLQALFRNGNIAAVLLLWVTIIVLLHGLLIFTIGGLFKQDWAVISVASNANVGGTATAGVLARTLGRPDLQLPGILVGSVGNAIGTYVGIAIATYLQ